jgi:UDP-2-acetamido-3-amino-2,3-dideoxy-glucuronate N-acetyltransferase
LISNWFNGLYDLIMIHPTALIEIEVSIGSNVQIWRNSHIRSGTTIGNSVIIGENVYIGNGVSIGHNTKIQNGALIYEPAIIEAGVFIGPGACLTNDRFPRAVNSLGELKNTAEWERLGVKVKKGASIGAGVVCVGPVTIGESALVGAGSVVTRDVCAFGLYVGNPAKQVGWVNSEGFKLIENEDGKFYCKENDSYYILNKGKIITTQN